MDRCVGIRVGLYHHGLDRPRGPPWARDWAEEGRRGHRRQLRGILLEPGGKSVVKSGKEGAIHDIYDPGHDSLTISPRASRPFCCGCFCP